MNGPKTLIEFMEMYKTEEDCRQALFTTNGRMGLSALAAAFGGHMRLKAACFSSARAVATRPR